MRIICKLVKWAVIIAVVVGIISIVIGSIGGVVVGFAIMGAVADGIGMASRAHRPGDIYVRCVDDRRW